METTVDQGKLTGEHNGKVPGSLNSEDIKAAAQHAYQTLEKLLSDAETWASLPDDLRTNLMRSAGRLSRPEKQEQIIRSRASKRYNRKQLSLADRELRSQTGIRQARLSKVFTAPEQQLLGPSRIEAGELKSPRNCYVCKALFTKLHHFYDQLCPACGDLNYQKRFQTADLTGQVVIMTGARLKIGYQAALTLLRSGARVIATTRFPVDAALRFSGEKDFADWSKRLDIYGLDLRHTPSVELFCQYIERKYDRLDILINNAAQTVRRPPGFYSHMIEKEQLSITSLNPGAQEVLAAFEILKQKLTEPQSLIASSAGLRAKSAMEGANEKLGGISDGITADEPALPVSWHGQGPGVGLRASAQLSQIPFSYDESTQTAEVFPEGELDADLQQVDLRETNSWRYKLADVPIPEMLEVQLVNAIAPFVLCNRLLPLMRRSPTGNKHIVNVTAMEGKFYRFSKPDRHPHTNMAKAALNMLTHTSAGELQKEGIYMNAVDTGWVTDEDPAHMVDQKKGAHDFQPPLDIVDGAARICDPFIDGILTGKHWSGKFLKDYLPIDW